MFVLTPISRPASPASDLIITSNDSYSTIEETSDFSDPIACYNILATLRTNIDNHSEHNFFVPLMNKLIQFDEELDDASDDILERTVLNQSLINMNDIKIKSSDEHADNMNIISQEDSSTIRDTKINSNISNTYDKFLSDKIILADNQVKEDAISSTPLSDVSKNAGHTNYRRMQSPEVESSISSFFDKDIISDNTKDYELHSETSSKNNEDGEMDTKVEFVKQEYSGIILSLKNQLDLYNKLREIIPECVRKSVENRVGVINFTYNQPDIQTDDEGNLHQTNVTLDSALIPQENSSVISSPTTSSSSGQNKKRARKSAGTLNGYNYFVKKQFKKSRNEPRNARDVISSSAKKWRELPTEAKKHYQEKAKRRREKDSINSQQQQQPRQPRIDIPGEDESELLAVVIPEFFLSSAVSVVII